MLNIFLLVGSPSVIMVIHVPLVTWTFGFRKALSMQKVSDALHVFGFGKDDVPASLFLEPGHIFRIGNPPLRIELLTDISGVNFNDCWAAREVAVFDDIIVNILDAESLKVNKKASGRMKDLNDLKHLP